jgi:acyl-CoA thioester hydrolase
MTQPVHTDQPHAGRFDGVTHLLPVRVYYEDTDFTGVVYHANYLRFMERGRSDMLRLMSQAAASTEETGAFAVVHMELDFLAAAKIHDALLVRTTFEGLKGPRLMFAQEVSRSGQILCRAHVVAVGITPDGRARRPTAAEMQHWSGFRQDRS